MPSTKRWKRTNCVLGHKRNFTHICSSCGHDKFTLRSSRVISGSMKLIPGKENKFWSEEPCNVFMFKCNQCSLADRFIVDDDKEYIEKILKLRDGVMLYVPPKEEWERDEEIKKRLEILGYI